MIRNRIDFTVDTMPTDYYSNQNTRPSTQFEQKPHWNQFKPITDKGYDSKFNKYDIKSDSLADTATTVTASSNSFVSETLLKDSSNILSNNRVRVDLRVDNCYDEIEMSASMDSHFDYLSSQVTKSMRLRKEAVKKHNQTKKALPPIPRSPSPFHSRLAESFTKSSSLRRESQYIKQNENESRPPFYTTIAKANSYSDSTVSSVSMFSFAKVNSCNRKISSSFHNRLAVTETISSSLRKQLRKESRPMSTKHADNRRPFYTTVTKSSAPQSNTKPFLRIEKRDETFTRNRTTLRQPTKRGNKSLPKDGRSNILQQIERKRTQVSKPAGEHKKLAQRSKQSVYERLANTGTASSLQKNRSSIRFKEEEKTLHESCKTNMMRDFKGSTFVAVTKGRVSKSVIGSVVNCG